MNDDWNLDIPVWATRISKVLGDMAGIALVGTMLMTVYDIFACNLGFGSIEPVVELTSLGVVIIASFGLAITTIKAGHVIIDLFTRTNGIETNRCFDAFWLLVTAVLLTAMAVLAIREGSKLHEDGTTTEVLEWSLLTFYMPPVAGWLLTAGIGFWIGIVVLKRRGRVRQPDSE